MLTIKTKGILSILGAFMLHFVSKEHIILLFRYTERNMFGPILILIMPLIYIIMEY